MNKRMNSGCVKKFDLTTAIGRNADCSACDRNEKMT